MFKWWQRKKGERRRHEVSPPQNLGEGREKEGQFRLDASLSTLPRWHSSWRMAKRPLGGTQEQNTCSYKQKLQVRCS